MILGIEASNIKAGGGLTHLRELILAYEPEQKEKLVLFAGKKVLESLPERDFIQKKSHPWLDKGALFNMLWRVFILPFEAKKQGINLLFSPGGNWLFGLPYVSMSQNMLVFESIERTDFPPLKTEAATKSLKSNNFSPSIFLQESFSFQIMLENSFLINIPV